MHATLNLVEHVLAMGRRYQEVGRHRDAVRALTRLSGFGELPAEAAEETQARLAEIHLKRRRFARARRHLAAALQYRPDSARYHFLMATALQSDDVGNLDRAADHFRHALALDPDNPRCLADSGAVLVRLGRSEAGLTQLRSAADMAPDDPEVLGRVAKGLRLAGKAEEARKLLRAGIFRNPKSPRFRKLYNDAQIEALRRRRDAQGQRRGAGEGPVLLPFVAASTASTSEALPAILRATEAPKSARRPDQRNVQ